MDKELKAMSSIQRTILALPKAQRERVLSWVVLKAEEGAWTAEAPKKAGAEAAGAPTPAPVPAENRVS